jgi:antitoxin ParD1/3/4
MNLLLSPELQGFLDEQLQSGKYESEADLYITALQSLADRENYLQAKRNELREAVRVGTEQADRGETIDGELAMAGFREKLEQWRQRSEQLEAVGE